MYLFCRINSSGVSPKSYDLSCYKFFNPGSGAGCLVAQILDQKVLIAPITLVHLFYHEYILPGWSLLCLARLTAGCT